MAMLAGCACVPTAVAMLAGCACVPTAVAMLAGYACVPTAVAMLAGCPCVLAACVLTPIEAARQRKPHRAWQPHACTARQLKLYVQRMAD